MDGDVCGSNHGGLEVAHMNTIISMLDESIFSSFFLCVFFFFFDDVRLLHYNIDIGTDGGGDGKIKEMHFARSLYRL